MWALNSSEHRKMGVYKDEKGRHWVQYYNEDGKRKRELVGTEKQAIRYLAKRKEEVLQHKRFGPEKAPEVPKLTVAKLLEQYWPIFRRKSSWKDDERYRRYWIEELGKMLASEVKPLHIEAYRTRRLGEGTMPATINRATAFLRRVYNLALKDEIVANNPVAKVEKLREDSVQLGAVPPEVEIKLYQASSQAVARSIEVALLTVMRQDEQFDMTWPQLDFETKLIRIPKSKHGDERFVPMDPRVEALLREIRKEADSEWVFRGRLPGTRKTGRSAYQSLQRACERAGVERVPWHWFRHEGISRMLKAGVPIAIVSRVAGHKSIEMTVRRYGHFATADTLAAVAKIKTAPRERHERTRGARLVPKGTASGTAGGIRSRNKRR
jgi:integrase